MTGVIQTCTFSDGKRTTGGDKSLLEHFGSLVQGYSVPTVTVRLKTDMFDAKHTLTMYSNNASGEILSRVTANTSEGTDTLTLALDPPPQTLRVYIKYSVVLANGASEERDCSYNVLNYNPPEIDTFSVRRWKYVPGQGNVAASDGDHVWVSLIAVASATGGAGNPATLVFMGNTLREGSDGLTYAATDDVSLYTATVPTSSGVQFTAVLTDVVTSVTKRAIAPADGAYFNVEPYGVAVGKRSSGYADDKMFEVAQDYRGVFRGDMSVIGDTSLRATDVTTLTTSGTATFNGRIYPRDGATFSGSEVHNGSEAHYGSETHAGNVTFNGGVTLNGGFAVEPVWEEVETVSGVNNPNGSGYGGGALKVGRMGNHVYLRGGVGTTSGHTIGYLDFAYCPSGGDRMFLVATANARVCRLRISTGGEIKCDAIYNLSNGSEPTSTLWIDCEVDYWI